MSERTYPRSVSQLKDYTRCGKAFELKRLKRNRDAPAAWTARGIALHSSLEDWEATERQADMVELSQGYVDRYDAEIERMRTEQPDYDLWVKTPRVKLVTTDIDGRRRDGLGQIERYFERVTDKDCPWEVAKDAAGAPLVEVQFNMSLSDGTNDVTVRGSVDYVKRWKSDGTRTPCDLKTGSAEDDYRQLGVYRLALLYSGIETQWGEYWYTKLDRSSGLVDMSRYTEAKVTKMFLDLDRGVQMNLFLANPSEKSCMFCTFKDTICPEWNNVD